MTRINLVPPVELMDQHLFAEFREIKMVPKSLSRSIRARGVAGVLAHIPAQFTLNTGHVSFFYDKGAYLFERFGLLRHALRRRGFQFNEAALFDPDEVMRDAPWCGHYTPTTAALALIRERIASRVAMKPEWYRYEGKALRGSAVSGSSTMP